MSVDELMKSLLFNNLHLNWSRPGVAYCPLAHPQQTPSYYRIHCWGAEGTKKNYIAYTLLLPTFWIYSDCDLIWFIMQIHAKWEKKTAIIQLVGNIPFHWVHFLLFPFPSSTKLEHRFYILTCIYSEPSHAFTTVSRKLKLQCMWQFRSSSHAFIAAININYTAFDSSECL
jgi:hypothetical protein